MKDRILAMALLVLLPRCAATDEKAAPPPSAIEQTHGHRHHGHGPHRFEDAEAWAERFEDPARDAWQKPDVVVAALGLTPQSVVADIGAATGYFPVRIARVVPAGRVYGVDIEPDMVRYLDERAAREGLGNLRAVLGEPADPKIPEPVDVVLIVDTYHHIEGREAYFGALRSSSLKPGGRVVIVDFKMGELPVGPPESMRIPPDTIIEEMARAGFVVAGDDRESLPYQVILSFTPAP